MTSSTSCTGKAVAAWLAAAVLLAACAAGERRGSGSREAPKASIRDLPVAVLPVENLSGAPAPLKTIRALLAEGLRSRGFKVLDEKVLEEFMASYRMRYAGGIDGAAARALRERTGAGAVLASSLELYDDVIPPKIALIGRLVSAGDPPVILWMATAGMAGDDAPGFLDRGMIEDSRVLLEKAVRSLYGSLADPLPGRGADAAGTAPKTFRPKVSYRSAALFPGAPHALAVMPFLNQSTRKYAGEILMLHFVDEMAKAENVTVVEPGVVRRALLTHRIIMDDGISLANADTVLDAVDADLLLTGKVSDYQDYQGAAGAPVVDFSLSVIDRKSREVVWSSRSSNKGTDGVWFFDGGKERTASSLASGMARLIRRRMWN